MEKDTSVIRVLIKNAHKKNLKWVTSPAEHHLGLQYLLKIAEDLLESLSSELNRVHGTSYAKRYWHLLIGPWLLQFLAVIYDRHRLLEGVSSTKSMVNFLHVNGTLCIPRNTYEAMKLVETDSFNENIIRDVYLAGEKNKLDNIYFEQTLRYPDEQFEFETTPNFRNNNSKKKIILNTIARRVMSNKSIVVTLSAIPLSSQVRLFLGGVHGLVPVYPFIDGVENYAHKINFELRRSLLEGLKSDEEFIKIVIQILGKYLPVCFLEGFNTLRVLARRYGGSPKKIITGTEMYSRSESYMHWVAKNALGGTKLASMQHGGNYGMEYRSEKTFIEINPYEKFYSWGWDWNQFGKSSVSQIKPMPSIFLSSMYPEVKKTSDVSNILFTVTAIKQNVRRLDCSTVNPYNNNKYFDAQMRFYGSLTNACSSSLTVRLYKDNLGNSYETKWKNKFPNVQFDQNKKFDVSLRGSTLFVCDHLTTTWIEALSINKPFVVFISPDLYDFSKEYEELVDILVRINVFFYSPEKAAEFVNGIFPNINAWWQVPELQKELAFVRNKLARSSNDYIKCWVNELKN